MKVVMNLNQNLSARTILARGTSQLALRAWKNSHHNIGSDHQRLPWSRSRSSLDFLTARSSSSASHLSAPSSIQLQTTRMRGATIKPLSSSRQTSTLPWSAAYITAFFPASIFENITITNTHDRISMVAKCSRDPLRGPESFALFSVNPVWANVVTIHLVQLVHVDARWCHQLFHNLQVPVPGPLTYSSHRAKSKSKRSPPHPKQAKLWKCSPGCPHESSPPPGHRLVHFRPRVLKQGFDHACVTFVFQHQHNFLHQHY